MYLDGVIMKLHIACLDDLLQVGLTGSEANMQSGME